MGIIESLIGGVLSGGATGLIGIIVQRWFDNKKQKNDLELVKLNHENAIALARIESESAKQVATVRADADMAVARSDENARADEAAAKSLVASYEHDKATYGGAKAVGRKGWVGGLAALMMTTVDFLRGSIRPGMTVYLCYVVTVLFYWAKDLAQQNGVTLSQPQIENLLLQIVATILYVFTTVTLWWFGTRPANQGKEK